MRIYAVIVNKRPLQRGRGKCTRAVTNYWSTQKTHSCNILNYTTTYMTTHTCIRIYVLRAKNLLAVDLFTLVADRRLLLSAAQQVARPAAAGSSRTECWCRHRREISGGPHCRAHSRIGDNW